MASVHTFYRAFQVDIATILRVIGIYQLPGLRVEVVSIANRTILATAKDLEHVALIDIHRRAAPYL